MVVIVDLVELDHRSAKSLAVLRFAAEKQTALEG